MSGSQWLLALHLAGALLLLGGVALAAALNVAALRSVRPSEVALFLGLSRVAGAAVVLGALATLVLGLLLVADRDLSLGAFWLWASLVLWVATSVVAWAGDARESRTRRLAQRLAAEGDAPAPELGARLRDPVSLGLAYGAAAGPVAILALMIWKPGG